MIQHLPIRTSYKNVDKQTVAPTKVTHAQTAATVKSQDKHLLQQKRVQQFNISKQKYHFLASHTPSGAACTNFKHLPRSYHTPQRNGRYHFPHLHLILQLYIITIPTSRRVLQFNIPKQKYHFLASHTPSGAACTNFETPTSNTCHAHTTHRKGTGDTSFRIYS